MGEEIVVISEKLRKVRQTSEVNRGAEFFTSKFKDEREWLVLGAACELMTFAAIEAPYYARKSESPDFELFDQRGQTMGGVEVAEILRPNYPRHQLFKEAEKRGDCLIQGANSVLAEPWRSMRTTIQRKAAKQYPNNTALLLYFNIGSFSFISPAPVHCQLLEEHSRSRFIGCEQFTRVLVLDSCMESLVRLSPDSALIFESRTDD